jgi:two-component system sensor histidine kinase TctE
LQPLREVAREAARRAASDLRPLPLEGVPREALPLIERINQLLAEVQAAVALQRRFVADAAHQLRTPVAGLRVLTQELALELETSPDQVQPLVQALLNSTERMSRLIGQLLALTRSGAALGQLGEAALQDIRPLLREAAEPLALRAVREGRNLWLELPEQPVLARAHPLWLGEALVNVLDNALRYGGPNIRVQVQDDASGPCVSICDDGLGVLPQDLPRLCEPFWRGERADTRAQDGTGLGLAIAHEIITRLGGRWQAQTRPEVAGFVIRWALVR